MRKLGWGGALVVMGLVLVATAVPVNAGFAYTLNMTGPAQANPGQTVQISAMLAGTGLHDSFLLDVPITRSAGAPNLVYLGYLLDVTAYQTGGADDFSVPKGAVDTGRLTADTPAPSNVHLEAVTRSGQVFTTGTLATMDFVIPAGAAPGQTYSFQPLADTFANGLELINTTNGTTHTVTVVPEPATLLLLGFGGLAAARRRLFSA